MDGFVPFLMDFRFERSPKCQPCKKLNEAKRSIPHILINNPIDVSNTLTYFPILSEKFLGPRLGELASK